MQLRLAGMMLIAALPAVSSVADPLQVSNGSPMMRIAAPPVAEPSRLQASGSSAWSLTTDWSSIATVTNKLGEEIALDGETLALTGRWRRGFGRWQLGVELSYMFQGGGVLDDAIDQFHDLFGLPEGDRPALVNDTLHYIYRRDGGTLIDIEGYSDGIGDLRLSAAWQAIDEDDRSMALRAQVKLPTGDSDDLLGSGGTDLSVYLDGSRSVEMGSWRPQFYAGVGVLFSDEGDVLEAQRETVVPFGHLGVAWPINDTLTLNLQFDAHGQLYDSTLAELDNAVQVSMGGSIRLAPRWELGIAVVEDIQTHSSPDVIFHFDLRRLAP